MDDDDIRIAIWNVRGLNDHDRCETINETISDTSCHIVCLQETKLDHIDSFIAASIGGHRFADRPPDGTRGGFFFFDRVYGGLTPA
jgi:exonuclease III